MKLCHGRVKANLEEPLPQPSFNWLITFIPLLCLLIIDFLVILISILL